MTRLIGIALAFALASGTPGTVSAQSQAKASGDAASLCRIGQAQSPIDIIDTTPAELPVLDFGYRNARVKVTNSGHAVKAVFGDTTTLRVGEKEYRLVEFHYHHPSEHLIDGTPAPLEVHLVHADATDSLAVVGVLFREGEDGNEALARMISAVGDTTSLDPRALLPRDHAYATYAGSLTTPPCSEGVRWLVLEEWMELSAEQLGVLQDLVEENARPVQALGDRTVKRTRDR